MAKTAESDKAKRATQAHQQQSLGKRKPVEVYDRSKRSKNGKKAREAKAAASAQQASQAKRKKVEALKQCFLDSSEDDEKDSDEDPEEAPSSNFAKKMLADHAAMAAMFACFQQQQGSKQQEEKHGLHQTGAATDEDVSAMQSGARSLILEMEEAGTLPVGACKEDLPKGKFSRR
ncbi:hypothetical protein CYMTET_40839 [Cymbomonas tetramitiformis]|uniref:Uncharacterized protein n=1 Tax=Cymbomonas tetramitiformis TaxID=36881 RepID=A0AAE0C8D0_9CHLO|nr:hypothetical protein CYMTET_40839 [Cymbomonas tetramitiformis]